MRRRGWLVATRQLIRGSPGACNAGRLDSVVRLWPTAQRRRYTDRHTKLHDGAVNQEDDVNTFGNSFEGETAAQEMQAELDRLFGACSQPRGEPPIPVQKPRSTDIFPPPNALPPRHRGDIDDVEPPAVPPKPRHHIIMTVERQQWHERPVPAIATPGLLTGSRWGTVDHQRYRETVGVGGYTEECTGLLETLRGLSRESHPLSAASSALRSLHSDALLTITESLVTSPAPPAPGDAVLLHTLWDLLCSPSSGRSLELGSKSVVLAAHLFANGRLSGARASNLYSLIYANRRSLRRWQNASCLRVLLRVPPRADAESGERELYSSCLNHCLYRCLDRKADAGLDADAHGAAQLIQDAVTFGWAALHHAVRQAALRGLLSRLRNNPSGRKGRRGNLPPYLEGIFVEEGVSPVVLFQRLEKLATDTDGFACAAVDRALLTRGHRLSAASTHAAFSATAGTPMEDAGAITSSLVFLASRPPLSSPALCEVYLGVVASVHSRVSSLHDLEAAAALAGPVKHHFPLLATILLVQITSLAVAPRAQRHDGATTIDQRVMAVYFQLFPRVDIPVVVETFIENVRGGPFQSDEEFLPALLRCITYHVPQRLVPVVLSRLTRTRELSSYQFGPAALGAVQSLVETLPLDSVNADEAATATQFVEAETAKVPHPYSPLSDHGISVSLLVGISKCISGRQSRDPSPDAFVLQSHSANSVTHAVAIHELFGHSAVDERTVATPEVVRSCQSALAWLYHVYSMSRNLWYELQVLAQLAAAQCTTLRLSPWQEQLVRLSEEGHGAGTEEAALLEWVDAQLVLPPSATALRGALLTASGSTAEPRADVPPAAPAARAPPTYVERLTREASWRCLSFYLNATLLEQSREKPDAAYPLQAQQELRRQLSLGAAGETLVRYLFATADDETPGGGSHATRPREILLLLNQYQAFLARQTSAFPYNKPALQCWGRSATCVCLMELLPASVDDAVPLPDMLAVYRNVLIMLKETALVGIQGGTRAAAVVANGNDVRLDDDDHFQFPLPPPALTPAMHEHMFGRLVKHPELWAEAVPLLRLASSVNPEHSPPVPVAVYWMVMQSCLMHRAEVPEFVRAYVK